MKPLLKVLNKNPNNLNRIIEHFLYTSLFFGLFLKFSKTNCDQILDFNNPNASSSPSIENINKLRLYYLNKKLKEQYKLNESKALFKKAATTITTTTSTTTTSTTTNPVSLTANPNSPLKRRICYYANWAPYRDLTPPLYPDQIDPALCTHIHFAFAKIDPKNFSILPTEEHDINWTAKSNMPLYIRLYGLKRRNTNLKILLAIGGL